MAKPTILVQLSDLHLGAAWEEVEPGVEPLSRLEMALDAILALPNGVDAVLVSGDVSDDGSAESYELARRTLERLGVPVHVLPGNHDDRRRMREVFGLPGSGEEPINYTVDVGELRLVLLDSIVPGQDPGALGPERMRWLDAALAEDSTSPTILALHQAPLPTGNAHWDGINWEDSGMARQELSAVVERHPQLRAIVAGHLHRIAAATLAGCPVLSVPSAYVQAVPDYEGNDVEMVGLPGFALHVLSDGELACQVEPLAG
ncbi:MAG TPA: phosphodiesterase [Solirubrobacterales bacterium]|nr:phosphodiesterase [Solirubrobacterales bacterium]